MVLPRTALLPLVMLSAASVLPRARSHAYLAEPRSRNLYASQEPDTWTEDCPHCMDRNEPGNFCGASQVSDNAYDNPPWGTPLQATYAQGDTVTLEFVVTTHHWGHFEVKGCPAAELSQACLEAHPLAFVADRSANGAPRDPAYPGRALAGPKDYGASPENPLRFAMDFQLPADLVGDHVILQWKYVTSNSCDPAGYDTFPFPDPSWRISGNFAKCPDPLPETGAFGDVPEQFWNCADVAITASSSAGAQPAEGLTAVAPPAGFPAAEALPEAAGGAYCCFYTTSGNACECESVAESENWCAQSAENCATCNAGWCG